MPHVEFAHLRAAAAHERAAVLHEQAAELFDGMGLPAMAREERARARLDRDSATVEREQARLRRERSASLAWRIGAIDIVPWRISGSYLEACNCEAICPCRRIGGRPGGRSTYGECLGALSWIVKEGRAGDVDLADMSVVLAADTTTTSPARRGRSFCS